jgi:hypothetical protein
MALTTLPCATALACDQGEYAKCFAWNSLRNIRVFGVPEYHLTA